MPLKHMLGKFYYYFIYIYIYILCTYITLLVTTMASPSLTHFG